MDKPYELPRSRLLPTLVVFVFVLGLLYTLFLVFDRFSLNGEIEALQAQKIDTENKIASFRDQQIEELFVAQELKDKVEARSIQWSKVIRSLEDLTPVAVFLSSYGTSEDGSIQVSGLGEDYGSVADIISALQKSSDFTDVFAPSVTSGSTTDGQSVVSFSLQLLYALQ